MKSKFLTSNKKIYKDEYIKIEGMVSRLDIDARVLKVVNTKIPFDDIYDLYVEKNEGY